MRTLSKPVLLFLGVFLAIAPAAMAATAVDLELALGVDISGSVDEVEARLQRDGYVAALTDPAVIAAIRSGLLRRIALSYFEWAGEETQATVVGWTLITGANSARKFAAAISAAPVSRGRYTSISSAIDYILPSFDGNSFAGTRRVIDLSGDGPNNAGRYVNRARDDAIKSAVTINGLPIVNQRPNRFGMPMPELDLYYHNCVIGGPGAFLVVAQDFRSFAEAIRRKLVLEIAGGAPAPAPRHGVPASAGRGDRAKDPVLPGFIATRAAPACDAGERRLQQRLRDTF